jgi:thiamine-monophosphate kinase
LPIGIGDDAAVLRPHPRTEWAISCDSSLEGIHFLSNYPPESIGYKSLARATSDLAAMGARPRYFLFALALPVSKTGKWLRGFASGMSRACREFSMRLIGGDTSRSSSVTICITVIGEIASGHAIPRSAAKPGDLVYVTGILGAAQLGLEIMLRRTGRNPHLQKLTHPHLYPKIPVKLAQSLSHHDIPSAMMDVSDGLSTDLARLCATSRVGARIYVDQLPIAKVPPTLLARRIDPVSLALNGGEDYVLLFTAAPGSGRRLRRISKRARITQIGEITRDPTLKLITADGSQSMLRPEGWQPF